MQMAATVTTTQHRTGLCAIWVVRRPLTRLTFRIDCGASVGALNCVYDLYYEVRIAVHQWHSMNNTSLR